MGEQVQTIPLGRTISICGEVNVLADRERVRVETTGCTMARRIIMDSNTTETRSV
jgi:hypothetical protein